jgi:hypothetical protein
MNHFFAISLAAAVFIAVLLCATVFMMWYHV